MTPERWQRVGEIVAAALERELGQRPSFLLQACEGDEQLRRDVEDLLSAHEKAGSFLERPSSTPRAGGMSEGSAPTQPAGAEVLSETAPSESEDVQPLHSGMALGRYVLLELVAGGGMGVVYRAHDPELNRKVALKLLRPGGWGKLGTGEARARLLREAQAMARLSHPNVIAVYDVGTYRDQVFIAMEYISGQTLGRWLAQKQRPYGEVLDVLIQAGRGLAAAHAAGVVHRDFKPDNVLVGNNGQAKVLDFGLARAVENVKEEGEPSLLAQTPIQAQLPRPGMLTQQLTKTGAFLGTPNYMAPEQLLRRATDARSDQFSFCVALYEGLYGQRPFQGDTLEALAAEVLAGKRKEPPNSRGIPSWVRRILLRGLRAESDERYPSMESLLLALERGSARSIASRRVRPVWLSAAGIALLLLVTLGLNLGGWRDRLMRQQHIQSIAVLPLKNASGDPSQQYLVDGMTDALISNLSQIGNLRVIPWAASMQHADESPREIGRQLNVDVVVRGSVLRVGTRVQVTGQLVHAATNQQFWARSYERELQDVLALQGDVAQDIANEFRIKLSSSERARLATTLQVNPEAYETYLKGHFHALRLNNTDNEIAINLLERAVSMDPAFARGYADLGRAYGLRLYYFTPEDKGLEEKAFVAVEKAIALDPNLAEAHLARAYAVWTPSNHFPHEQAVQACRRALALNPNLDEARDHLAAIYLHIGLLDKALEESQRAVAINATNVGARYRVGVVLHHEGRYEEALAILRTVPKDYNPALASRQIAWTLFSLGKREEAAAIIEAFFRDNPADTGGLVTSVQAMVLAAAGNRSGAEEKIKAALEQRKGFGHFHHSAYNIASAYALMNEPELALHWLREAANDGYPCYPLFEGDASLKALRTDSRFIQFMADLNRLWNQYKAKL